MDTLDTVDTLEPMTETRSFQSPDSGRPLAVVTGGSSGIGLELAKQFAENGFDLIIAAEQADKLQAAAAEIGGKVETVTADLSTEDGVQTLYRALNGREVDALAANAGRGLGEAFLDQEWDEVMKVVDTNITGTIRLVYLVGADMRARGDGKILITSSIASQMPGSFHAVYNATKAFLQSFSFALRNELKDSGVSVTALLPGATETNFFAVAGLEDTKVGQAKKDDPAKVARDGFEALMKGEGDVVSGLHNKLQVAAAKVIPDTALAEQHRGMAEPGSGQ